jgi:hypothetical protein
MRLNLLRRLPGASWLLGLYGTHKIPESPPEPAAASKAAQFQAWVPKVKLAELPSELHLFQGKLGLSLHATLRWRRLALLSANILRLWEDGRIPQMRLTQIEFIAQMRPTRVELSGSNHVLEQCRQFSVT